VADVLDAQLRDRDGVNAGRVDGVVLLIRDGQPPLVTHIEVGPITLLARFSTRLAQWYAPHDRRFGRGRGERFRIAWSAVRREDEMLRAEIDVNATPINALEDWLRVHIVERLPWSS
jgi:hypothetical protein